MISLKVSLLPKGKLLFKDCYEQELTRLCQELINYNRFDYVIGCTHSRRKKADFSVERDIQFSKLLCSNYEKRGNYIIFNDEVKWYIKSHSYDLILDLVQGFFKEGIISINNAEFEVNSLEVHESVDISELSEVS